MDKSFNPEITAFIDRLAETGSNYRIDEMRDLYAENLGFLFLTRDGEVARLSKQDILEEFTARGQGGEPPLSTEKRILHIEEQGDEATAVLYRRMSPVSDPALYELRLKKLGGQWRVYGETVMPWPDLAAAKGFLPPRKRADAPTAG